MKVAELTGESLDWWVAQLEGMLRLIQGSRAEKLGGYSPSTKWAHGGPIIEREGIELAHNFGGSPWAAMGDGCFGEGPTPLIAAMRAYVSSKLGDEVPDEVP